MRIGGRRIGDPRNYGKQTPTDILVNSSNLGTSMLALELPKEFFLDKFFSAGFGESTDIGLIGESNGIMHTRSRWSKVELATLSYGMGVAATPLQLARFYSALANGGVKKPLTIIKRDDSERIVEEERIFSSENT